MKSFLLYLLTTLANLAFVAVDGAPTREIVGKFDRLEKPDLFEGDIAGIVHNDGFSASEDVVRVSN